MKEDMIQFHTEELYRSLYGDAEPQERWLSIIRSKLREVVLQAEIDLMKSKTT